MEHNEIMTIAIVILTGLISYRAFNDVITKQKLIFHPASVKDHGEYYRFLSHGLIHADWTHLLINLYVLYIFGGFIEVRFQEIFGEMGRVAFLVFYFSAIIVASIPTYFRYQDQPYYKALGASGATSALVFAYVIFNPWGWFIFPPLPAILFAVAYLWYSNRMDKQGRDNIGHNAHFWGAVYGLVFTLVSVIVFASDDKLEKSIKLFLGGPDFSSFPLG